MSRQQVRIWDLPTRLFHWTLVAGIGFMWFSAEVSDSLMDWHARVGEFLLALILFRLIWGIAGSESSRFTAFLKSPAAAIAYAKTVPSRQPSWHAGHNPLGGWMVVALLLIVLSQAVTGLFATDDIMVEGPLYALVSADMAETLTSIHHLLFNVMLLLVILHVMAIAFYAIAKRTNLVRAMLKGDATWPEEQVAPTDMKFRSGWLGLVLFVACYAAVYFGLRYVGG